MKILILHVQLLIYVLYVKMGMFYQYFVVMIITGVIALFMIFQYTNLIMTRKFKQWWSTIFTKITKTNNQLLLNTTINYDIWHWKSRSYLATGIQIWRVSIGYVFIFVYCSYYLKLMRKCNNSRALKLVNCMHKLAHELRIYYFLYDTQRAPYNI